MLKNKISFFRFFLQLSFDCIFPFNKMGFLRSTFSFNFCSFFNFVYIFTYIFIFSLSFSSLSLAQESKDDEDYEEYILNQEDLPAESISPRVDSPYVVLRKKITHHHKIELLSSLNFLLDEPFYGNTGFKFTALTGLNEYNSLGLSFVSYNQNLSEYAQQFKTVRDLDFTRAPSPKRAFSGIFEQKFIYGKISFSQETIVPTVIFSQFQFGYTDFSTRSLPFLAAGLGERLYLNSHFGVWTFMNFSLREIVNPLSQDLHASLAKPLEKTFTTKVDWSVSIELGASYLF